MGGCDVTLSVAAIIGAYTSCRKVLDKIRAKRNPKKGKAQVGDCENEIYLNKSLIRAPCEINDEYTRGLRECGQYFGTGDAFAQTILQTTLAKLNSGLVDIIQSFLTSKDPTKLRLDFKALSALSDISRMETTGALAQLKDRISRSMVGKSLMNRKAQLALPEPSRPQRKPLAQQPRSASKKYVAGLKQDKHVHWAIVRPRPQKKSTAPHSSLVPPSSSNSSTLTATSRATKVSTDATALYGTPTALKSHMSFPKAGRGQIPHSQSNKNEQSSNYSPSSSARLPLNEENLAHIAQPLKPSSFERPQLHDGKLNRTVPRRRVDKPTESFYSFASDSTKLGEIPMDRWPTPYNFEEMARLNAEAEATGWTDGAYIRQPQRARKNQGLLARVLRISPLAGAAGA